MKINEQRLIADLYELGRIGVNNEGGVSRPALSQADIQAREWFRDRVEADGFLYHQDGIGNISAILRCRDRKAQTIMCGSHLDTVPNGGRYDGALGVVAALEVLRTIKENKIQLPYQLEAISFTDEEGAWHGSLGSLGIAGKVSLADFKHTRGDAIKFKESLSLAGISPHEALAANRKPESLKAWVEVHIEQGSRLEEGGIQIGVVTEIVGIANYRITFIGRADHSGTTIPSKRKNALFGLAHFITDSHKLICDRFPEGVMNCGKVGVEPNVVNIVPGVACVTFEVRHIQETRLSMMKEELHKLAGVIAGRENLTLTMDSLDYHPPASMSAIVISAIEKACDQLDLTHVRLISYAGHDTQVMSGITPSAMFFVPSLDGASHSPREFTRDTDCVIAAEVLLHTVLELANS